MLRLTAVALVAAVLVWSVLFVDLLRKRGEPAAALTPPTDQSSGPDDGRSAEAPAPVTTRYVVTMPATEHDHRFRAFGTDVGVLVHAATPLDALRVHALFQRMHRALTRFDGGSELSALNARAGETVTASATLLRAVEAALWAARASDGLVDATVLDALEHAGYAGSRDGASPAPLVDAIAAAPARRSAAPRPSARWRDIALDPSRRTIRLPAGVRIDLGGSAKGLAVDLAAELLGRHATYAVDVGGDIRIGGTHRIPRTVRIRHPLDGEIAHSFAVTSRRRRHQRPADPPLAHRARLRPPPHRPRPAARPPGPASSRPPPSHRPRSRPRCSPRPHC